MDNLKYYNDSLAYDFNMFMPRQKKEEEKIVRLPKVNTAKKAKARAKTRALSSSAFVVLSFIVIFAALCGNIFLRLRINEVSSKINATKAAIEDLDSEQTSLNMELERRISYSNIELEATEMGMQKKDKSQVKYIRVNDKNTASTKNGIAVTSSDE